mgnify:CR=1 FL=1
MLNILRRLIIPCVSNASAGHNLESDVGACNSASVRLSGHSDWVFGLVCLLGRPLPSLESHCFKKAAGHIRFLDVVLLSAHGRRSLRQVVYAITAACAVLLDEPSSTIGGTTIPALSGSQSVLFFNIAHATTRILRARAMAAFFLRVFWPP